MDKRSTLDSVLCTDDIQMPIGTPRVLPVTDQTIATREAQQSQSTSTPLVIMDESDRDLDESDSECPGHRPMAGRRVIHCAIANDTNLLFFHICRLASFFRITVVVNKDIFFSDQIFR